KDLIKNFDTFVFDLDGTFWWYPKLVDGAKEIYEKLIEYGKRVIFVSNFTYLDREGVVEIFRKNGIFVSKEQIITSSYVAAKVLKNELVFPIGKGLEEELKKNGVRICKNEDANSVVIGHDTNFNYNKANVALKILLKENSKFYTTAYGKLWIFKNEIVPGTGLITAGLEYCSGKRAIMLGKPSDFMLKEVRKVVKGKVIYFGDENKADMEFAKKAGFFSVFVKNGVDRRVAKEIKPDAVINSIKDLLRLMNK
ncbi:MAG: HAD-IIA family hydrolase, partial [Candidatus Aenigmarchaeota archaeon]|nr:HAD-IIA family hydrolase [Candidatus Aenigmarchaeota archaeon]